MRSSRREFLEARRELFTGAVPHHTGGRNLGSLITIRGTYPLRRR